MDTSLQAISDVAVGQATLGGSAGSPGALSGLGNLAAKLPNAENGGALDKAAGDFESMFMTQMLQPMFEGIGSDPVFGGGHGEEVMKTFLVQEYGKAFAKSNLLSGHAGITSAVRNEMISAQARASHKPLSNPKSAGTVTAAYHSTGGQNGTVQ